MRFINNVISVAHSFFRLRLIRLWRNVMFLEEAFWFRGEVIYFMRYRDMKLPDIHKW